MSSHQEITKLSEIEVNPLSPEQLVVELKRRSLEVKEEIRRLEEAKKVSQAIMQTVVNI